jgi:hypothetical protein
VTGESGGCYKGNRQRSTLQRPWTELSSESSLSPGSCYGFRVVQDAPQFIELVVDGASPEACVARSSPRAMFTAGRRRAHFEGTFLFRFDKELNWTLTLDPCAM